MSKEPGWLWDDGRLVEYVRKWAIEQSKCGRDGYAAGRIDERHIFPAAKILRNRGAGSVSKLLPLLHDSNAEVRLAAASIAYEVDKPECRKVLEELAKTLDMAGIIALMTLSVKEGPDAAPDPGVLWGTKD
jgi:hypothetical protein